MFFFQFVHLLVLSLFAVVVLHPEIVQYNGEPSPIEDMYKSDNLSYDSYNWINDRRWTSGRPLQNIITLLITYMKIN